MWEIASNDELYHYGILGMKWGVRRYQNPDGSLTEAGKKRYNTSGNNEESKSSKAKNALRKIGIGLGGAVAAASVVGTSASVFNKTSIRKSAKSFSNDELKTMNARSVLESQYKKNNPNPSDKLFEASKQISEGFNRTSQGVSSAGKVYSKYRKKQWEKNNPHPERTMSDAELRQIINRINMEKTYNQLTSPTYESGFEMASDIISMFGGLATISMGVAITVAKIMEIKKR